MATLEEKFKAADDEFLEFDGVKEKRSQRRDVHAFMLLDELFPGSHDIVVSAEHDRIWLDPSEEQLQSLTFDQVVELQRCGVFLEDGRLTILT